MSFGGESLNTDGYSKTRLQKTPNKEVPMVHYVLRPLLFIFLMGAIWPLFMKIQGKKVAWWDGFLGGTFLAALFMVVELVFSNLPS